MEEEAKRLERLESKKQKKYSEDTKFTHRYMFVITSLPAEISAEKILACYRLRWQIELVFKRMKSLLQLGSIPTKTKESAEVWLNGKILLSLLTEKNLGDIDFSPSWNLRRESEHMERDQAGVIYRKTKKNPTAAYSNIVKLVPMGDVTEKRGQPST